MKTISLAAAGLCVVLIALTLAPGAGDYRVPFATGALVCSVAALAAMFAGWRQAAPTVVGRAAPPHANAPTAPAPPAAVSAPIALIGFLAALQEKGRLVDFLQDDVTGYTDAQVGAAARVVHHGCKTVLDEYFRIVPVRAEAEGATVTVPAGFDVSEYRLAGTIAGPAPFSGTLVHRGWRTAEVTLPRRLDAGDERLPAIAPAEVELRSSAS